MGLGVFLDGSGVACQFGKMTMPRYRCWMDVSRGKYTVAVVSEFGARTSSASASSSPELPLVVAEVEEIVGDWIIEPFPLLWCTESLT